jgi:hypothetical protein
LRTRTHGDVETWRCDACGAYTDEPLQVCSECQAKRLDGPILSSEKKARRGQKRGVKTVKTKQPRKKATKSIKSPKNDEPVQDTIQENSKLPEAESDLATIVQAESPTSPEIDDGTNMPQDATSDDNRDELVVGPTDGEESHQDKEVEAIAELPGLDSFSESAGRSFGDRFILVYVNTPVPELIKRKIDIDFETFPTISIGRSPENVVVIPDAGVSRTHAELRKDADRVMIKDLQSSNGTFIYDGKEFRKVETEAEVGPNTLVKFGTGTILRFVSE